ncbi:HET-domain-containing protein [Mytilinidion resinicola]|uniref:HET-domain-containing protein n=1 Tax=Mytilinidion resinicola TaxID=574789 RepID=A0A6A6YVJ4_9PEZI|nr:HET-domain-containing protein [Mytilinidion resinicola]KAF2812972.1 HET-domain-containing protein [Mytilinidion resinicola]
MALCSACSSISVEVLIQDLEDPPNWWGLVNSVSKPRGMIHLQSALQLKQSCPLCAIIRASIVQYNGDEKFPRLKGSSASPQEQWDVAEFEEHLIDAPIYLRPKQDFLRRSFPEESVLSAWHLRGFTAFVPVQEDVLTGVVRLFAQPGSAAALSCDVIGRLALPSSNCPEAYTLLRRWIGTCVQNHQICRETLSRALVDETTPPVLPTRILDIWPGNSRDPRLIETHGSTGYYAALSHCWPPPHKRPIMTTLENYEDRKAGIPWATIPLAYQHAIVAAREIGLTYLWIDSLCIYSHRSSIKPRRILRFAPQFSESFHADPCTYLAS